MLREPSVISFVSDAYETANESLLTDDEEYVSANPGSSLFGYERSFTLELLA